MNVISSRLSRTVRVATGGGVCMAGLFTLALALAPQNLPQSTPAELDEQAKQRQDEHDVENCVKQLERIYQALEEFRKRHPGHNPDWLSDLARERILAEHYLVCPKIRRTHHFTEGRDGDGENRIRDGVFADPSGQWQPSYAYEFANVPLPLWPGLGKTYADYKMKQRTMHGIGDRVPIVRCFAHDPRLNLALNGEIYTSGDDWELNFTDSHDEHYPVTMFQSIPPKTDPSKLPPRPSRMSSKTLDLTPFYNAYLDEFWLPYLHGQDLREFQRYIRRQWATGSGTSGRGRERIEFDARGIIQLKSTHIQAPYPILVEGIPVADRCRRIHVLHATSWEAKRKVPTPHLREIAHYQVHYADGSMVRWPIRFGAEASAYIVPEPTEVPPPLDVVWEGQNPYTRNNKDKDPMIVRVFQASWENPKPSQQIDSISLRSLMKETAPFVLAITLED